MMTLIIGGSGSGKSAYAEDYITSVSGTAQKYYIATMQVYDAEGEKKIERHRMLRSGKGFTTIEQQTDIQKAAEKMSVSGKADSGEKIALLECMSNLVANEMFSTEIQKKKMVVTDKIVKGINILKEELQHLVIVSNNVFEDGCTYEQSTMEYIQAMGMINTKLADMADEVIEVVVGIPVIIKPYKIVEKGL